MKIKLLKFKSVKSTNDTALRLIKNKYSKLTMVTSLKQTRGRGTMGKRWISKKGNLFFTIFFELNQKKINFKHFAILNAYLIRRIISKEFKCKIKIKWPNDLLFSKKKNLWNFAGNNYIRKKEIFDSWNGNKYKFRPMYSWFFINLFKIYN